MGPLRPARRQQEVEGAPRLVEDDHSLDRDRDRRDHDRHEQERGDECAPAFEPVEREREPEAQHQLDRDAEPDEVEAPAERRPEARVVRERVDVVLEADPVRDRRERELDPVEALPERVDQRVDGDREQHGDGRQHHQPGEERRA